MRGEEGPIRYRGKWAWKWYDATGRRQRTSLGIKSDRPEQEARAAWRRIQRAAEAVEAPEHLTVAYIWDRYAKEKASPAALPRIGFAWKNLEPVFGAYHPSDITLEICRGYTARERKRGASDGTIHTDLGYLRTALVYGEQRGLITRAPMIERPPKPRPRHRHLTREQAEALIENCRSHHIRLFTILALTTAGRTQALLDLTWGQVDFDSGIITLDNAADRTRKGRATVPMNRTAREALVRAYEGRQTDYVIEYGGPVKSVKKGVAAAARRAGLEWVTPHILRHTAAVWMAQAGVSMSKIANYMGHSDSKITERVYARYSPDHMADAADALELHTGEWFKSGSIAKCS